MNVEYDAIFYFVDEQNEAHAKKRIILMRLV